MTPRSTTPHRNDSVFQLSLTEIAFTISFILLLLLGYLVFREESERQAAVDALSARDSQADIQHALDSVKKELRSALAEGGVKQVDDKISKLVDAAASAAERDRLKAQVESLDAQLTALVELQKLVDAAEPGDGARVAREAVAKALAVNNAAQKMAAESQKSTKSAPTHSTLEAVKSAFATANAVRSESERILGGPVSTKEQIQSVMADAKAYRDASGAGQSIASVRKENTDLRGQVAFLKNRLDARGGRDFPPCWADEKGKPEFLFAVELRPEGVFIMPAWSERRAADAAKLPGVDTIVGKLHPLAELSAAVAPVFNWSRRQDPECRHYVLLRSTISDAVASDRARLRLEDFFYKSESRR